MIARVLRELGFEGAPAHQLSIILADYLVKGLWLAHDIQVHGRRVNSVQVGILSVAVHGHGLHVHDRIRLSIISW